MRLSLALKDKKFREGIILNIIFLFIYEFMLYIAYFEWANSMNIKLQSSILAGVSIIVAIVLISLGFGNKNIKLKFYGAETFGFAVFSFLSYYVLTVFPNNIKIAGKTIYIFIPFVIFFIYYLIKILVMIINKLKK